MTLSLQYNIYYLVIVLGVLLLPEIPFIVVYCLLFPHSEHGVWWSPVMRGQSPPVQIAIHLLMIISHVSFLLPDLSIENSWIHWHICIPGNMFKSEMDLSCLSSYHWSYLHRGAIRIESRRRVSNVSWANGIWSQQKPPQLQFWGQPCASLV